MKKRNILKKGTAKEKKEKLDNLDDNKREQMKNVITSMAMKKNS